MLRVISFSRSTKKFYKLTLVSVYVNCLLVVWSFVRIRKLQPIFSFLTKMASNKLDDKASGNTTDDKAYDLRIHTSIMICISGKPATCHKDKTIAQFLTFSFLNRSIPCSSCFHLSDSKITLCTFFFKKSTRKNRA